MVLLLLLLYKYNDIIVVYKLLIYYASLVFSDMCGWLFSLGFEMLALCTFFFFYDRIMPIYILFLSAYKSMGTN